MLATRLMFLLAGLSGAVAVGFGAYASHGLSGKLDAQLLGYVQMALQYHFYHTLAILACAVISLFIQQDDRYRLSYYACCCFVVGLVLFCGSFYYWALSGQKLPAFVTPFGGGSFILGWLCLAVIALRGNKQ